PADRLQPTSAEDGAIWSRAVAWYGRRYPDRGFLTLLENDELVGANRELGRLASAADLAQAAIPAELRTVLEEAAPFYRRGGGPIDEQAAHGCEQRLAPRLARHGRALAGAHAKVYGTPWPDRPISVELAAHAGPVGAYTVLDPTQITMAS